METISEPRAADRAGLLRRGVRLNVVLLTWNVVEGFIAVGFGLVASSVALITFGIDSFIEVTSAAVVTWRLWRELRGASAERAERLERTAARVAGSLLLILAVYVVIDAGRRLFGYGEEAGESIPGIILTAVSVAVMPLLGWAKLRVADRLGSRALRADAVETLACAWLSAATLLGLSLNAAFGWAWADPVAALAILPLVIREGIEGLQSASCGEGFDDAADPTRP